MLAAITFSANQIMAQDATANQLIKVHIEPTINITAHTSSNIDLNFNNQQHYANGVQSDNQVFKVNSNRDFVVSVKTDAAKFTYSGSQYPAPQMPVNDILFLAIANNSTGGNVASAFNSYKSLSSTAQDLLLNCRNGADQTFAINYKANPGNNYPAGDYTVGVVYTATQP